MQTDIERLKQHVDRLARSPRPAESTELQEARRYVIACLEDAGWEVRPHPFQATSDEGGELDGVNVRASRDGFRLTDRPRFCVGAHLDSVTGSPGADDNASAVATLLELARMLPHRWPTDSQVGLELVVFDLEEHGMLGGAEHARLCSERGVNLCGMVSLEMLGYCDHTPGSQALPRVLAGQYPDTGDFIGVIGNQNSGELIETFGCGMRRTPSLKVETLQVPANGESLQATRLSDHSPFWDAGYAALMITDTSFLRNPHYHTPADTPETLDMQFLHHVAEGCLEAVLVILQSGLMRRGA